MNCSERKTRLLRLAGKIHALFVFLRTPPRNFDEIYQEEFEAMYCGIGQGEESQPPALMCMAVRLQGYLQVSDAEAVRLSGTDNRWRMVLTTLTQQDDAPAFSQGEFQRFRERRTRHDMDRRVLKCTVELARQTRVEEGSANSSTIEA